MTESALSPLMTRDVARGDDDDVLVEALRRGDETAFLTLVGRYGPMMLRVAQTYVRSRAVAEEVVQETWLGVLSGIDRFEGRSSLKTWLFRILTNRAKTRGERESRSVPFSALAGDEDDDGPSVPADRFLGPDHPQWPGHWAASPSSWSAIPDERLMSHEVLEHVRAAIEELPIRQRQVISLRDVEGWSADEVCDLLALSEGNQRVLLHRARSKVRGSLERYFDGAVTA
jgi:RNA polymerase sigma-70 factor, ECF subfamily